MLIVALIFLAVGFFMLYSDNKRPNPAIRWTGRGFIFVSGVLIGRVMGW